MNPKMQNVYPAAISSYPSWVAHVTPYTAEWANSVGFEFYSIEYELGTNVRKGFDNLAERLDNYGNRIAAVEGDYVEKSGGAFEGNIGFNYYRVEYASLYSMEELNFKDESVRIIGIKDEDDMASDSAIHGVTQQSVKAYYTRQLDSIGLIFGSAWDGATITTTWATPCIQFPTADDDCTGVLYVYYPSYYPALVNAKITLVYTTTSHPSTFSFRLEVNKVGEGESVTGINLFSSDILPASTGENVAIYYERTLSGTISPGDYVSVSLNKKGHTGVGDFNLLGVFIKKA